MTERKTHVDRVKRCHKARRLRAVLPGRSPHLTLVQVSVLPKSLLRQKKNLLPPELQVNDHLVVPDKPKRITFSIKVGKIDIALNEPISLRL